MKSRGNSSHMGTYLMTEDASAASLKPDFSFEIGVHVCVYLDYSSRYGIGYILSDGTYGLFFNDNTLVVQHEKVTSNLLRYFEKEYAQNGQRVYR